MKSAGQGEEITPNRKAWRRVLSIASGLAATFSLLWFTQYSRGAIVSVSGLWLVALIAVLKNTRRKKPKANSSS